MSVFFMIRVRCDSAVLKLMPSSRAISFVDLPSATSWSTSRSREVSGSGGISDLARYASTTACEIPGRLRLDDVPLDAGAHGLEHVVIVGMHRQQDRARPRADLQDLARGVEPIQERHREVEHGDVRATLSGLTQRLLAVPGLGDDRVAFALQQSLESLPDDCVVVSEENPIRHCLPPPVR